MLLASRHLRLLRAKFPQRGTIYGRRKSLHMPPANAVQRPQELVQIVDERNNAVGKATRAEMRAGNLIHRCSFAIVQNTQVVLLCGMMRAISPIMFLHPSHFYDLKEDEKGALRAAYREPWARDWPACPTYVWKSHMQEQLYVQKRVAFKETFPSHYDPAPGGVVGFGESYEDNAVRELEEEMGITGACLETLFDFWYSDNTCRLWGRLFRCKSDGPFVLDPEEVETGSFMSLQEVVQLLKEGPVCPDSALAVQRFLQEQHSSLLQGS